MIKKQEMSLDTNQREQERVLWLIVDIPGKWYLPKFLNWARPIATLFARFISIRAISFFSSFLGVVACHH